MARLTSAVSTTCMRGEIAPLKKAEDAVLLDTSEMTLEESEEAVKKIILAARDGQKE